MCYIYLTTVLFLFPPDLPVSGSNMSKSFQLPPHTNEQITDKSLDYCVAAFGIVLIISTFQWIVDGRKNFTGPRTDLDVLAGEMSVPVETTSNSKSAQEELQEK